MVVAVPPKVHAQLEPVLRAAVERTGPEAASRADEGQAAL
jgi:hypothetical protein